MPTVVPKSAKIVSLVRKNEVTEDFFGLVSIGERMARGLRTAIASLSSTLPNVVAEPIVRLTFAEWRAKQVVNVGICRFKVNPLKGFMLIALPPQLVAQMVDTFYGGAGEIQTDRTSLSKAEIRFLERVGALLVEVIAGAWSDICPISPLLVNVETEVTQLSFVKDDEQIIVLPFAVSGAAFGSITIECIHPVASLRAIKALSSVPTGESARAVDSEWSDRLRDATMQVSFPLRTVFARTELPLTRLLSLQIGDLIPICLPSRIPVTVGGRVFAHASVGESNGRASIRIENLEQGLTAHG
jgi:flagellar motor switch protein FliM